MYIGKCLPFIDGRLVACYLPHWKQLLFFLRYNRLVNGTILIKFHLLNRKHYIQGNTHSHINMLLTAYGICSRLKYCHT